MDKNPIFKNKRLFNRGFFDRTDPFQNIGENIPNLSMYHLYSNIDQNKIPEIRTTIYNRIINKVTNSLPDKTSIELISFADKKLEHIEGSRDYIIITNETPRKTRSTIAIRCLSYGGNLYLGVDSFALGSTNQRNFIARIYFSIIPLAILIGIFFCLILQQIATAITQSVGPYMSRGPSALPSTALSLFITALCSIPLIYILIMLWIDVIRGFYHHKDINRAIREVFNHFPSDESFNTDDILMFLKSILPIVVESIEEVFKENGINIEALEQFRSTIQNITNISETFVNYTSNQGAQGMSLGSIKINNPTK
jgi:hypothetical protein